MIALRLKSCAAGVFTIHSSWGEEEWEYLATFRDISINKYKKDKNNISNKNIISNKVFIGDIVSLSHRLNPYITQ